METKQLGEDYPGIILKDISEEVAELRSRHTKRKVSLRDVTKVDKLFVHHSGASGAKGPDGPLNSTKFVMLHRGWSMPGYHFWIPEHSEYSDGAATIYQIAPINWLCYHTKGVSVRGVGVVCQGNKTRKEPTENQIEGLEALIPYIKDTYLTITNPEEDWLSWHSESDRWGGRPKKSCPGVRLQRWLEEYRDAMDWYETKGKNL